MYSRVNDILFGNLRFGTLPGQWLLVLRLTSLNTYQGSTVCKRCPFFKPSVNNNSDRIIRSNNRFCEGLHYQSYYRSACTRDHPSFCANTIHHLLVSGLHFLQGNLAITVDIHFLKFLCIESIKLVPRDHSVGICIHDFLNFFLEMNRYQRGLKWCPIKQDVIAR